jgi:FkbH-like protein
MHHELAAVNNLLWMGSDTTDETFIELSLDLLRRGDISLVPNMLVLAQRHQAIWETEAGQELLIGLLQLLIEAIDAGDINGPLEAMRVCPAALAQTALNLMLAAFFPDGTMSDPDELDDAALLTVALLLGASGRHVEVSELLDRADSRSVASAFGLRADMVRNHFTPAAQEESFKAKLVIWDLDDTLWRGTLADGDEPLLIQHRADYVRAFNGHGIVSAICSKNDFATARAKLEHFGLWDEFVFPRIAFVPKGVVVRQMIADMQLRPANVLFIDDNPHNLQEVAAAVPGIKVVDATRPDCDALLQQILDDNAHISKSRIADYRLLETKVAVREANDLSDEAFLTQSGIHACFVERMDNLDFADRMEELINRSNQLNYTQSRITPGTMRDCILDMDHYIVLSVFVWDKYGYYGLVGVAVWAWRTRKLEHFALSCRVMHMGIEDAMARHLATMEVHKIDPASLRKPLPAQSASEVTAVSFADAAARKRILEQEAPRDWSKIALRIMADCQSGALYHYSRFRDVADYDNNPRLFSLPMMATGEFEQQDFPPYLVFAVATDYQDWRWAELTAVFDHDLYRDCADRFVAMVIKGGHKCLILIPPDNAPLNLYWRAVCADHADNFSLIELSDEVDETELIRSDHYRPSALKRIAGRIDQWFAHENDLQLRR